MGLITTFPPLVQNLPVRFPRMAETKQDITCTDTRFHLLAANGNKVFSLMNKLNTSKVTSLDGISARLSREYAVLTRDTLNYTIRQSKLPGD